MLISSLISKRSLIHVYPQLNTSSTVDILIYIQVASQTRDFLADQAIS